ncbi:Rieske 2Fe-2S domain-containing protein [Actinomycetaceae bacterium TAE3-ERU4]|nr:Rieske 2Fe-2S domain-containing protein [Actinomycetaceae bacterium TAE3-ERU4]
MSAQVVCQVSDLDPGEAMAATILDPLGQSLQLAVVRDELGDWYAIEEMCPHGAVSLTEGDIGTCEVECWAHGARFNLATGEATMPSPRPVKTYEITLDGDDVLVDVGAEREGK